MPKEESATTPTVAKARRATRTTVVTKRKKDPNAPKKPLSAYMFFAGELGEHWKRLTPEEKRPYEEKAAADKKRYEAEKAAYKPEPEV